jgi:hypothetical protein
MRRTSHSKPCTREFASQNGEQQTLCRCERRETLEQVQGVQR